MGSVNPSGFGPLAVVPFVAARASGGIAPGSCSRHRRGEGLGYCGDATGQRVGLEG